jgi:acetyl esterase/lipase
VYRHLLKGGTAPEQIVLGGDSAGGGLTMSVLLALRENSDVLPAAAVLLSPWVDLALTGETLESRAQIDPLTSREGLTAAAPLYLGGRDPRDPLISPVYADLRGLPPLLIQVGDHEVLLSDSTRLADRARAAGVDVCLEIWPEMWHAWQSWAAQMPEAQQAIQRIGKYIRQKLGK